MNSKERIAIYGALALLLALNLSTMLGLGSPAAIADAIPVEDELGPAATLTLTDEDEPLVLRSTAGRLAWADNAYARAYSVAFMAPGKAMEPLLKADQFVEERQELDDELRTNGQEFERRINAYQQQNADITPDDPRAAEVQQTFQAMLAEYEQWRAAANVRMGQLTAGQVERAYRDMVAAVEVVAERKGIDIVYRFIATAQEFGAVNPPQAYLATRQRLALVYPDALDITDAVLEELSVETE
ncbi:MAG: OmpH family outer membrane protein [Phycisphaerales bacterium]